MAHSSAGSSSFIKSRLFLFFMAGMGWDAVDQPIDRSIDPIETIERYASSCRPRSAQTAIDLFIDPRRSSSFFISASRELWKIFKRVATNLRSEENSYSFLAPYHPPLHFPSTRQNKTAFFRLCFSLINARRHLHDGCFIHFLSGHFSRLHLLI